MGMKLGGGQASNMMITSDISNTVRELVQIFIIIFLFMFNVIKYIID